MIRVEPWADPALRIHEIEQQLLTLNLENKRQWYDRQPDPPLVPPDWLTFTGMPPTSSTTTSSTSSTTSSESSSTTTVDGTCPTCLIAFVGEAEYMGSPVFAAEDVPLGPGGVFGMAGPCSYGGNGDEIIHVGAAPVGGDPTADWHATVAWPNHPEDSPHYEQAVYLKAAPNTGAAGTYTLFREPPVHNLTYPANIELVGCGSTSSTSSTSSSSSSTTTTIACSGTCLWLSDAMGGWSRTNATTFKCAELATCEDCDCPEPSYTPGGAGIYDSTSCGCGANPTTTTTTTTTTTSSSSSTTTTVACPGGSGAYEWESIDLGGGLYAWDSRGPSGGPTCSSPEGPPDPPSGPGETIFYYCATCSWGT